MAADPDSIIKPIVRMQRWLVGSTVVLFLALAVVTGYAVTHAINNKDALCALRADQEQRVEDSRKFLADNSKSKALLTATRRGIETQESTIAALSNLDC